MCKSEQAHRLRIVTVCVPGLHGIRSPAQGGYQVMDYYQGIVVEYLRADRSVFVNAECCIQLNEADSPDGSGLHWYCDALAVDFTEKAVYLCEVSYSKSLRALLKRLASWNSHWTQVKASLARDSRLPSEWPVRPWLFIPEETLPTAAAGIKGLGAGPGQTRLMPEPKITTLESVAPWKYRYNRKGETDEPDSAPD